MIRSFIHHLANKPNKLFVVDSIGAFITAVCIWVLYHFFAEEIGIPKQALITLSFIAGCFCVYSTTCFLFLKEKYSPFIRGIAIANFAYCLLTAFLLLLYTSQVSVIGTIYFLGEIGIVLSLVYIELQVAKTFQKK